MRLAALLVNGLTDGHMRGRPYPAPQGEQRREAATEALRSISPDIPTVTAHEADELATLSVALRSVFAAVGDGDLDTAAEQVNRLLDDTRAQPRLNRHDEQLWHLHYQGTTGGLTAIWAGVCATALAIVLGSDSRHRLGICTAPAATVSMSTLHTTAAADSAPSLARIGSRTPPSEPEPSPARKFRTALQRN